ncbi:MAG: hypothetical protein WC236_00875 [Gallionellaceae bacterium]
MFTWIKNKTGIFKTHLLQLGDEQPLSKATLVVLVFLDIFILISVFDGLDEHTRQLVAPDEYVTYSCREIVIQKNWNQTNRLDNLNDIISSYNNRLGPVEDSRNRQHPICSRFAATIDQIETDNELLRLFENRKNFQRELRELEARIKDRKGGYDTALLENIASHNSGEKVDVSSLRQDVQRLTSTQNTLRGQLTLLDENLNQAETIKTLWQNIQTLTAAEREQLKSDLHTLNFWFPVKQLGMQLLFLLPLLLVIYSWNAASIRKARYVQTLVSSHLLVVVCIPVFFKIIETVYDIIPKRLLKLIADLLVSLNLIAIWYYLFMLVSVAAALFVIYLFQKKLFSHSKLLEKRIARNLCQKCGKQLPHGAHACHSCSFVQYRKCLHCDKLMHVYARYCMQCGKPQENSIPAPDAQS